MTQQKPSPGPMSPKRSRQGRSEEPKNAEYPEIDWFAVAVVAAFLLGSLYLWIPVWFPGAFLK